MAREVTVDVDIRVIGQPECCRKYREAGWKFTYQPGTKFIQADHPLGGKHSVVEVIDISRNDYESHEIGKAIAMLLNGLGEADDVVPCPACNAKGEMFATGIRYAEGHSGPSCRMLPCPDCGGKKMIPSAMLEWQERGNEIRRWRRANELTLRDVAERAGILPSEVSGLECGRVDNSNWRELFKVK